jgi:endonuclease/exonuclease/phosphatase family metal-dependent hydrolase
MEELMSAFKFSNSTHYPLYHSTIYNQQKIIDYCFTKNIEVTTGIDDIITEQIADHKALTITLTKLL